MARRLVEGIVGTNPPYHAPAFVLTHYEREPLVMEGGTTFYFVTGGIEEALRLAKHAAGDKDVKVGGGVSTVRQYLQASLFAQIVRGGEATKVFIGKGQCIFRQLRNGPSMRLGRPESDRAVAIPEFLAPSCIPLRF
jgi:dihydrofolate reductase